MLLDSLLQENALMQLKQVLTLHLDKRPFTFRPSVDKDFKLCKIGLLWVKLCESLKSKSLCWNLCHNINYLINHVKSNLSPKTPTPLPCAWCLAAPAPKTSPPPWWMSSAHARNNR